jgi:Uma2 family endonuclease
MSIAQPHAYLSPEDFLRGEDGAEQKHEYLNGVVYAMAGGTNRHARIAGNIFGGFFTRLRGQRCQPFNSDTLVRVQRGADLRFYYPDLSVVCDSNALDETFQERPVVIFEVLSESTARLDRGEKREAYLTIPSLRVLALVETETMAITLWRRVGESWTQEYANAPGQVLAFPEIECELPLAEIYEGSGLTAA